MGRIRRAVTRAQYAALGAAVGAAVGGLFGRSTASTGGATGALVGAVVGEFRARRAEPDAGSEGVTDRLTTGEHDPETPDAPGGLRGRIEGSLPDRD